MSRNIKRLVVVLSAFGACAHVEVIQVTRIKGPPCVCSEERILGYTKVCVKDNEILEIECP